MKRIISLILMLFIVLSLFVGCDDMADEPENTTVGTTDETTQATTVKPQVIDVWDGTIASSFSSGSGTEADPYCIKTGAELAYLASSVNSGASYAGKYVVLVNDINLNNVEWTPIGNGEHAFEGNFNGNDNTITNLKITDATKYSEFSPEINRTYTYGVAGLFGFCSNVNISNIGINYANISIKSNYDYDYLYMGVLAARIDSNTISDISNINIGNAEISTVGGTYTGKAKSLSYYCGGISGQIMLSEGVEANMSRLQSEVKIFCEEGCFSTNFMGSIVGRIYVKNSKLNCSDFVGYLDLKWNFMEPAYNFAGAFGEIGNQNSKTNISNAFCKMNLNYYDYDHDYNMSTTAYRVREVNAIGYISHYKNTDGTKTGRSELKNLFGCVKPSDENAGFSEPIYELYPSTESAFWNETNCQGCESLPENHGLDESVWDCSDPSAPKLR